MLRKVKKNCKNNFNKETLKKGFNKIKDLKKIRPSKRIVRAAIKGTIGAVTVGISGLITGGGAGAVGGAGVGTMFLGFGAAPGAIIGSITTGVTLAIAGVAVGGVAGAVKGYKSLPQPSPQPSFNKPKPQPQPQDEIPSTYSKPTSEKEPSASCQKHASVSPEIHKKENESENMPNYKSNNHTFYSKSQNNHVFEKYMLDDFVDNITGLLFCTIHSARLIKSKEFIVAEKPSGMGEYCHQAAVNFGMDILVKQQLPSTPTVFLTEEASVRICNIFLKIESAKDMKKDMKAVYDEFKTIIVAVSAKESKKFHYMLAERIINYIIAEKSILQKALRFLKVEEDLTKYTNNHLALFKIGIEKGKSTKDNLHFKFKFPDDPSRDIKTINQALKKYPKNKNNPDNLDSQFEFSEDSSTNTETVDDALKKSEKSKDTFAIRAKCSIQ